MQVAVFPLRDYRATKDTSQPDTGAVVVWRDASEKWSLLRASLHSNIIYALLALFVVELVLVVGWRLSERHLDTIIQRQTADLEVLATRDGLTSLWNRRCIEERFREEAGRATRYGHPFSVILFDLDHFKKVNDTYGHNAGDEVLTKVSARADGLMRATDSLGRWGGEEFLVVAPETTAQGALTLAERVREGVEGLSFATAAPITISLGIAEYVPGEEPEGTIRRADDALYQAKEAGRNRSVVAEG